MSTYNLHEAKTHLSRLIEAVLRGEEVTIARYGTPVAQLIALPAPPQKRTLGFYPIAFTSDLTEPTEDSVMESFYTDAPAS